MVALIRALFLLMAVMARHKNGIGGTGRHPNPRFTGDGGGSEKSTCN